MYMCLSIASYFVGVIALSTYTKQCIQNKENFNSLGNSSQLFAADVFKNLERGNKLISPLLLQSVLSMLPTKGLATNQMKNVLHLKTNQDDWINSFQNFLKSAKQFIDIELYAANAIYLSNNIQLTRNNEDSSTKYITEIKSVDFSDPFSVVQHVNEWVKTKTNKKISNIIDVSSLSPDTSIILLSVLCFNGKWHSPFDTLYTFSNKFYSNGKDEVKIDMMTQKSEFNFAFNDELDANFLEIPYKNRNFKLTVVLPNTKDGLSKLERKMDKIFIKQNMDKRKITLFLPKFKIETKVDFEEILKKLGLTSIFSDEISLFGSTKMKVDKIVQKTHLDVNEVGTEVVSVTEVEFSERFGAIQEEFFVADHPFLFFISEDITGVILFFGRFTEPAILSN